MFPIMSIYANTKTDSGPSTNMAAVSHLKFFLLSRLLGNKSTGLTETWQSTNLPFGSQRGLSEMVHRPPRYCISSWTNWSETASVYSCASTKKWIWLFGSWICCLWPSVTIAFSGDWANAPFAPQKYLLVRERVKMASVSFFFFF